MKLLALAAVSLAFSAPSKTVRLTIVHTVEGCHVWVSDHTLGANAALKVKPGTKVVVRVSCPMNFTVTQRRGPALKLGDPTFYTGTQRTIVFSRRGVYVISAVNIQSSEQMGLQTLGPDNQLTLRVIVR